MGLSVGKRLPDAIYLHTSALDVVSPAVGALVDRATELAGIGPGAFNVVKLGLREERISLLWYPDFFEDAFPALATSWAVALQSARATKRSYRSSGNPPILHRKETLLPPQHPAIREFRRLTEDAERYGLFRSQTEIGRKRQWEERLREAGLMARGNELVHVDDAGESISERDVQRHRTAMVRYTLSAPMQALWRHGYLDGAYSVFDFGCGRGDDLRALKARGLKATGWDPHFAPGEEKVKSDIVNLGFVLNVIEDRRERLDALRHAWQLSDRLLSVSVILGGRSAYSKFEPYGDGVMTARGTFQKYYTQDQLREYIAEALGREPIAIGPGLYFVFKTDDDEQAFLAAKQLAVAADTSLPAVPAGETPTRTTRRPTKWDAHADLVERFWQRCLVLGRPPAIDEFEEMDSVRDRLGSARTVYQQCVRLYGERPILRARDQRKADRLVYLALNILERRRSLKALPEVVRRDVKAFWGSFAVADTEAKQLLFSIGRADALRESCEDAAGRSLGHLGDRAFTFHSAVRLQLPPILRVYVGCAEHVYGDFEGADLIKVHIGSTKVSLMKYDDFDGKAVPMLLERIKVTMGRADFQVFEYGEEFPPQPLYLKSRYLPPQHPGRDRQAAFDQALEKLDRFDFSGYGPSAEEFAHGLHLERKTIRGYSLDSVGEVPSRTTHA